MTRKCIVLKRLFSCICVFLWRIWVHPHKFQVASALTSDSCPVFINRKWKCAHHQDESTLGVNMSSSKMKGRQIPCALSGPLLPDLPTLRSPSILRKPNRFPVSWKNTSSAIVPFTLICYPLFPSFERFLSFRSFRKGMKRSARYKLNI